MHHFARNECLPQHADTSLLLKVLHKAEVLLFYVVALSEHRGWRRNPDHPICAAGSSGPGHAGTGSSVPSQCHLPSGSLWFQGDSNVTPRAWIWALLEKSVVQDHQVRKYNLAISVLRKRHLSPSVSLPYTRTDTYLAIPAYNIGEVAKTRQKKGLKPLWIMYWMGTNFHL